MLKITQLLTLVLALLAGVSRAASLNSPFLAEAIVVGGEAEGNYLYWYIDIPGHESLGLYHDVQVYASAGDNYIWDYPVRCDLWNETYESDNTITSYGDSSILLFDLLNWNGIDGVSMIIHFSDTSDGEATTYYANFTIVIYEHLPGTPNDTGYLAQKGQASAGYAFTADEDVSSTTAADYSASDSSYISATASAGSTTAVDDSASDSSYIYATASAGSMFSGSVSSPYVSANATVSSSSTSAVGTTAAAASGTSTPVNTRAARAGSTRVSFATKIGSTATVNPAVDSVASSEATVAVVATESPSTTVITLTSCSDNGCSEKTATTGIAVYTSVSNGVEVVYTTYCPLTGLKEHTSSSSVNQHKSASMTSSEVVSETASASTTVPTGFQSVASYSSAVPTVASLSTYSGLAPSVVPLSGALCGSVAFLLALFV